MELTQIQDVENKLMIDIEELRREMIQAGIHEGFTSKKTIELSQKLDNYIYKYLLCTKG